MASNKKKWATPEWVAASNYNGPAVTFDGEELDPGRWAHGSGMTGQPSEKNRKHYASHPRRRSLMDARGARQQRRAS